MKKLMKLMKMVRAIGRRVLSILVILSIANPMMWGSIQYRGSLSSMNIGDGKGFTNGQYNAATNKTTLFIAGKKWKTVYAGTDGEITDTVYSYDEKGRQTSAMNCISNAETTYDENGHPTTIIKWTSLSDLAKNYNASEIISDDVNAAIQTTIGNLIQSEIEKPGADISAILAAFNVNGVDLSKLTTNADKVAAIKNSYTLANVNKLTKDGIIQDKMETIMKEKAITAIRTEVGNLINTKLTELTTDKTTGKKKQIAYQGYTTSDQDHYEGETLVPAGQEYLTTLYRDATFDDLTADEKKQITDLMTTLNVNNETLDTTIAADNLAANIAKIASNYTISDIDKINNVTAKTTVREAANTELKKYNITGVTFKDDNINIANKIKSIAESYTSTNYTDADTNTVTKIDNALLTAKPMLDAKASATVDTEVNTVLTKYNVSGNANSTETAVDLKKYSTLKDKVNAIVLIYNSANNINELTSTRQKDAIMTQIIDSNNFNVQTINGNKCVKLITNSYNYDNQGNLMSKDTYGFVGKQKNAKYVDITGEGDIDEGYAKVSSTIYNGPDGQAGETKTFWVQKDGEWTEDEKGVTTSLCLYNDQKVLFATIEGDSLKRENGQIIGAKSITLYDEKGNNRFSLEVKGNTKISMNDDKIVLTGKDGDTAVTQTVDIKSIDAQIKNGNPIITATGGTTLAVVSSETIYNGVKMVASVSYDTINSGTLETLNKLYDDLPDGQTKTDLKTVIDSISDGNISEADNAAITTLLTTVGTALDALNKLDTAALESAQRKEISNLTTLKRFISYNLTDKTGDIDLKDDSYGKKIAETSYDDHGRESSSNSFIYEGANGVAFTDGPHKESAGTVKYNESSKSIEQTYQYGVSVDIKTDDNNNYFINIGNERVNIVDTNGDCKIDATDLNDDANAGIKNEIRKCFGATAIDKLSTDKSDTGADNGKKLSIGITDVVTYNPGAAMYRVGITGSDDKTATISYYDRNGTQKGTIEYTYNVAKMKDVFKALMQPLEDISGTITSFKESLENNTDIPDNIKKALIGFLDSLNDAVTATTKLFTTLQTAFDDLQDNIGDFFGNMSTIATIINNISVNTSDLTDVKNEITNCDFKVLIDDAKKTTNTISITLQQTTTTEETHRTGNEQSRSKCRHHTYRYELVTNKTTTITNTDTELTLSNSEKELDNLNNLLTSFKSALTNTKNNGILDVMSSVVNTIQTVTNKIGYINPNNIFSTLGALSELSTGITKAETKTAIDTAAIDLGTANSSLKSAITDIEKWKNTEKMIEAQLKANGKATPEDIEKWKSAGILTDTNVKTIGKTTIVDTKTESVTSWTGWN